MPEFILDRGTPDMARAFTALDPFTQGYIEAMFFTSTGTGDDGDLGGATVAELAPEALATISRECNAWRTKNASMLALVYATGDYDEEQAGRDYWFTRNGHGVGFWDRDLLQKIIVGQHNETNAGDELSRRARHSERYIYRGDDGRIYYA